MRYIHKDAPVQHSNSFKKKKKGSTKRAVTLMGSEIEYQHNHRQLPSSKKQQQKIEIEDDAIISGRLCRHHLAAHNYTGRPTANNLLFNLLIIGNGKRWQFTRHCGGSRAVTSQKVYQLQYRSDAGVLPAQLLLIKKTANTREHCRVVGW